MPRFHIIILLPLLGGCAAVQPWEKAGLAQPQMRFKQSHPTQAFLDHAISTVEQAEGGNGRTGSSCGCR